MQTPSGRSGHASRIAFNSSNREPSVLPWPAVFSSRIRRLAKFQSSGGLPQPLRNRRDGRCRHWPPGHCPGESQDNPRPAPVALHDFLMKRLHRTRAQDWIRRSEVDQIIAVDHQRPELQFRAPLRESAPRPSRRSSTFHGPTSGGSTKISAARWRPAHAQFRARRQYRLRWRCEFRCGCCHLSRREFQVAGAVPDDTRRRRRTSDQSCNFLPPFPQVVRVVRHLFYRKAAARANGANSRKWPRGKRERRWNIRERGCYHFNSKLPSATPVPGARSPSGKAKVCKTFIGGSIPPRASKFPAARVIGLAFCYRSSFSALLTTRSVGSPATVSLLPHDASKPREPELSATKQARPRANVRDARGRPATAQP